MERPDFDFCRALNRILWVLLLLASPFILFIVFISAGAMLPALVLVVGGFVLMRMMSASSFLSMFSLFSLLNGNRNSAELVPVRYIRLRERMPAVDLVQLPRAGRPLTSFRPMQMPAERIVRIKGEMILGNLVEGEVVSFWGRWRGGTLHAAKAYSHFTRSWIQLRRSHSGVWLLATLTIIGLLVLFLSEQMQAFDAQINSMGVPQ